MSPAGPDQMKNPLFRGLWLFTAATGWAALGLMAVLGAVDVVGASLFDRPLAGVFEMSEQALAVVIFFGLLHAQIGKTHIVVDVLTEHLRGRLRLLSNAAALTATAVAIGLIAAQTWPQFLASWKIGEQASGLLGFPVWPVKGLVSLACFGTALVATAQGVAAWGRLFRPLEDEEAGR